MDSEIHWLLGGVALVLGANGLLGTEVALALSRAAGPAAAGWGGTALCAGIVLGAQLGRSFARRLGVGWAYVWLCVGCCVTTLLLGADSVTARVMLRALTGVCLGGIYLVVESRLATAAPPHLAGRLLAAYVVTCQVALVGGQGLVWACSGADIDAFVLGAALYGGAALLGAWRGPHVSGRARARLPGAPPASTAGAEAVGLSDARARGRGKSPLRVAWLEVAGAALSGYGSAVLFYVGPALVASAGHDAASASGFVAAALMGGLLAQWPLARLREGIGSDAAIGAVCLGLAVTLAAAATVDSVVARWLPAVGALAGAAVFSMYPLSVAAAHERVGEVRLSTGSALLGGFGVGAMLGPALTASLHAAGVRGLLVGLGAPSPLVGLAAAARWAAARRARSSYY